MSCMDEVSGKDRVLRRLKGPYSGMYRRLILLSSSHKAFHLCRSPGGKFWSA
jgi:hypothetical protein